MCLEEEQSGYKTKVGRGPEMFWVGWRSGRAGALGWGRGMTWAAVGGKDFGVGIVGV